jgi:deoxyribonucleoside regulator
MRGKTPDIPRLVEVARLYYESGLTQEKIAQVLKVSRPAVQRMIQAARDLGFVTITITDPLDRTAAVGRRLQAAFGLGRVIVVPSVRGDADATKVRVGEAGARYLDDVLRDTETLGVAWGTTVRAVARALHPRRLKRLRVVQMVGELGLATEASETFRAIADRLDGQAISLPAPAMEKNPAIRRSILQSAHIQEVFRILREAHIVLTGIGPVSNEATIVKRGQVTENVMRRLAKQGAVGEMNTKFFDTRGRALAAINSQIIGMELDDIRRIPHVVAVVSDGPGKDVALLGALRGKYADVLVTDEVLAGKVLSRNDGA